MISRITTLVVRNSRMSNRGFLDVDHKKTFKQRSLSLEDVFEFANAREVTEIKNTPTMNLPPIKSSTDDIAIVSNKRPLLSCPSDDFDDSSDTDKEASKEVSIC